jgi:hypothetical protein
MSWQEKLAAGANDEKRSLHTRQPLFFDLQRFVMHPPLLRLPNEI